MSGVGELITPVDVGLQPNKIVETDLDKKFVSVDKGAAYNKNFGSAVGEVAQGNDPRFHNVNDDQFLMPVIESEAGLRAVATFALNVDHTVAYRDAVSVKLMFYKLIAGTDIDASPGTIRPDDFALVTNEKVWKLGEVGSASGVYERDFQFSSDIDNIRKHFIKGTIQVVDIVSTAGISSLIIQTSLDNGATYIDHADVAALISWITSSGISGNSETGTDWIIRITANFNAGELKDQNAKLIYQY